jgi:hypothetical protein
MPDNTKKAGQFDNINLSPDLERLVKLSRKQTYENLMAMCESRELSYGMTLREVLSILNPQP